MRRIYICLIANKTFHRPFGIKNDKRLLSFMPDKTIALQLFLLNNQKMKILLAILALLNGGYMLADGIYCLIKGKYIGPDKPGPWANLFYKLNIDVFNLSPLFIAFGVAWLLFLAGLWTGQSWAYLAGITVSILTLWYLPIGTVVSIAVLIILLFGKSKLGI